MFVKVEVPFEEIPVFRFKFTMHWLRRFAPEFSPLFAGFIPRIFYAVFVVNEVVRSDLFQHFDIPLLIMIPLLFYFRPLYQRTYSHATPATNLEDVGLNFNRIKELYSMKSFILTKLKWIIIFVRKKINYPTHHRNH
jgi:hypothetical protein